MARTRFIIRLLKDDRATSSVEYGLILSLMVLAMLAALSSLGTITSGMWNNVSSTTSSATKQAIAGG